MKTAEELAAIAKLAPHLYSIPDSMDGGYDCEQLKELLVEFFLAGIAWRDENPKKSILIMEAGYIDDSGKRHVTDRIIKEEKI